MISRRAEDRSLQSLPFTVNPLCYATETNRSHEKNLTCVFKLNGDINKNTSIAPVEGMSRIQSSQCEARGWIETLVEIGPPSKDTTPSITCDMRYQRNICFVIIIFSYRGGGGRTKTYWGLASFPLPVFTSLLWGMSSHLFLYFSPLFLIWRRRLYG